MRRIVIVSIAFLPLLGCGPKKRAFQGGDLSGTVTYKGQPVNGALLRFYPATITNEPSQQLPPITTTQDGKFSAANIPPGEYKVVVEPSPGPPKGVSGGGMRMMPKDAAKAEEMKRMQASIQKDMPAGTIPIPEKYKNWTTTDLKATVNQGDNKLTLELKDK